MPDPISNSQQTTIKPMKPVWVPGIGAFVLLDYRTGHDPSHLEQSVVFVPSTWESMHGLLYAPGQFMQMVLNSYSKVVAYNASNGLVDIPVTSWPFAEPITIHIEPLTAPSPSNLAALEGLSFLYPHFKGLLDAPAKYGSVREALIGFRGKVMSAAAAPTANLEGAQIANQETVAKLLKERKGTRGGSGGGATGSTLAGTSPARPPIPTFPLSYVAEYALDTRVLTIRYIPRHLTYSSVNDKSSLRSVNQITPLTINPIQYMNFKFLHFDIAFPQQRTPEAVAEARANLAMDFIENPLSLNPITADVDVATGADKYFLMNDALTTTGNDLFQKKGGPANPPSFTWPQGVDPSLILDSVLADPSQASGGNQLLGGGDPSPSPCVIVVWIDGVPYYVVIKNYN